MSMTTTQATICLAAALLAVFTAPAQPAYNQAQTVDGELLYRDHKQASLYYYQPADYRLVTDEKGAPEFSLIQMRYTGTRATDDEGASKYHNLLRFRIAAVPMQPQKLASLKTALRKINPAADLRPMPVLKFSSVLVFAGTGTGGSPSPDSLHLVKPDYSEATDDNAASNNSYWVDRMITLRLNNYDAQLVETALKNKQAPMSFSYAIYTAFAEKDVPQVEVRGNKDLQQEIRDFFSRETANARDSALHIALVKTNAISLGIDPDKYPSTIQKVDINEKVPAKYPLFDVYCYDFNNGIRADLFAKRIELKATGINGSPVTSLLFFKENQPDMYARSIRFAYAVRFDKPYYYRVTEITRDGDIITGEWIERKEWYSILDITSPPEKRVIKPVTEDEQ